MDFQVDARSFESLFLIDFDVGFDCRGVVWLIGLNSQLGDGLIFLPQRIEGNLVFIGSFISLQLELEFELVPLKS